MSLISPRVLAVKESATLAITAKAAHYKASGRDIISLAAGEPDFDTPQHIKDAAKQAIDSGFTKYTAVAGIPRLKAAVVAKLQRDNQLHYQDRQIIVGTGGKQCIFNACLALLAAGDEMIIPAPYWVSYADMALLAEAVPVIVPCPIEQGFKMSATQLEAAITPRTKLLMLNSPSNPTGAVYSLSELQALGEVLLAHPQVMVATDDIYEHINLSGEKFCNIINATPALQERTVLLNGVSKAYAMTGWRIGYAAGPLPVIKAMEVLQSQSTSNPTSIAQIAALAALEGPQDCIVQMTTAFRQRHDFVLERLNTIRGLHCLPAQGAFYAFSDARPAIERLFAMGKISANTDLALADYLLETFGVAVVPGSAFGAEGYFRISFATSMQALEQALERIASAITPV